MIRDIPEIAALDGGRGLIRIPPELDVPLKSVEAATSRLKTAQARIEQAGAIVDISIKVAGAAGAVAIFVAAPNMASAQAAAGAIAAATGALP